MAQEGRSIEDIAADLKLTRDELRGVKNDRGQQENKNRVIQREADRQARLAEKRAEDLKKVGADLAEAREEIASLQQQLRQSGDLNEKVMQADADRADALGELEEAREKLSEAQHKLTQQAHKLSESENEVKRLKKHEEQSNLLKEALDMLGRIV